MIRTVAPQDKWPSGDRIHLAALPFSPDQLADRYGITFETGLDDLGEYELAAIELAAGSQVWLERHEGDPQSEILVLVDANADVDCSIAELLKLFDLSRTDLVWISPRVDMDRVELGVEEEPSSIVSAFTIDQAAQLAGLTSYQVLRWIDDGLLKPSITNVKGVAFGRLFNFRDLVGLRTLATLRIDHEVSKQELQKLGGWLEERYDSPWSELTFFVAGRKVYFHDPTLDTIRFGRVPEQTAMRIELKNIAQEVHQKARDMVRREPEEIGQIVRHRNLMGREPVIAGTRIRTEGIWNLHRAGYSIEEIIDQYPRLTVEDVKAAIMYESERREAEAS